MLKKLKKTSGNKSVDKPIESSGDKFSKVLDGNIKILKEIFKSDKTVIYRNIEMNGCSVRCCVVTIDGMIAPDIINRDIIRPVMESRVQDGYGGSLVGYIQSRVINAGNVRRTSYIDEAVGSILYGDTILMVDGEEDVLIIDTKGWAARAVTEPDTESVVRGPREGLNESLLVNTSLVRRRLRTPDLKFIFKDIGTRTKTTSCICYIEGLAQEKIVNELAKRLDSIIIDGVLDSGYVEELIKDAPLSPFKTVGSTERPDLVVAELLEGRAAVLLDGTPFALIVPYIFVDNFQSNEDYYQHFIFASFTRALRYLGFFLTTSVPALYTALITYQQEMIPTPLLLSIASNRQGVPFPTIAEVILMSLVFEIIREAGVRLPRPAGQAVSIVGALVLGEAAVSAKIVGPLMVIVVAITGISSFLVPKMQGELIVIRFTLLILAGFLGLYGYVFGVIGLFIHLMSIRSFGVPYMLNTTSINGQDIKDTVIRAPWWYMYFRPRLFGGKNPVRFGSGEKTGGSGK